MTTGHVIFDLGLGGNTGQRFFSGDISHELGLGNVTIILGSCTGVRDEDSVIYGSPEIFTDEVPFRAELAAKAGRKDRNLPDRAAACGADYEPVCQGQLDSNPGCKGKGP